MCGFDQKISISVKSLNILKVMMLYLFLSFILKLLPFVSIILLNTDM